MDDRMVIRNHFEKTFEADVYEEQSKRPLLWQYNYNGCGDGENHKSNATELDILVPNTDTNGGK